MALGVNVTRPVIAAVVPVGVQFSGAVGRWPVAVAVRPRNVKQSTIPRVGTGPPYRASQSFSFAV
jgi:hypothetical protein